MIRIRAIGTAEVRIGRTRIRPDSVVLFALALYLGLTAGERIGRTQLLELLWPGVPDQSRRHSLRQLLYRLRRIGFALALDGDQLLLERSAVDSDLDRLLDAGWPERADADAVEAAASVLPGYAPPMPELFREWLDAVRARVDAQYRRAVLRQIAAARREGRWRAVDEWSRRCLAADPLNEEATLASAEAAAMTGAKARALQILDEYLDELGDRRKVIGLPAKVLRRRISELGRPGLAPSAPRVPLIGRAAETARLNEVLERTLHGAGGGVFVVGVPGIGKSALAQDLVESATMRGWTSLAVRLHASDLHRPLAIFVDLFSALLRLPGALGCAPASLTQLRRLTQHDVEDPAAATRSQEPEAVQERIRTSAVDLLGSITEEGPLIVLLDDLHWMDEQSARLLQYLVERTRGMPLCWLLAARPEARYDDVRHALAEELVPALTLGPLGARDGATLLKTSADDARPIAEEKMLEIAGDLTRGNPLFIREVAKHFVETGDLSSLPSSLRALIRGRIARISTLAQHVLHTCAILGRYSTVPRVAGVLEISTAELLACIEELEPLGILGAGRDADALSLHDLWQEELLSSMLTASRNLIHHRCGVVLEAESKLTRSATMVWEAARHLIASGAHGRALRLLEDNARHLLDNGFPVDAARMLELALEAAVTDQERLQTMSARISALHRAGDWAEIARVVAVAIALLKRVSHDSSRHSDLELLESEVLFRTGKNPTECVDRTLACVLDSTASSGHRLEAAKIAARTASNLARLADLRKVHTVVSALPRVSHEDRANALIVEIIFHTEMGSLESAIEAADTLISMERQMGSVRGLARALRLASIPLRCVGEFERAMAQCREALDLAERLRLADDAYFAADLLVTISLERRDLDAARAWLIPAESWAGRVAAPYAKGSLSDLRAQIALATGDEDTASALLDGDLERRWEGVLVRARCQGLSLLVRLFALRKDSNRLTRAVDLLGESLELSKTTGRQDYFVESYAAGLAALGMGESAVAYVREYVTRWRRDKSAPSPALTESITS